MNNLKKFTVGLGLLVFFILLGSWAHADSKPRICLTGNTSVFYAQEKRCGSIERHDELGRPFRVYGHFIGANSDSANRPTLVFIPGGPGDSGADLFLSFEQRAFPGALQKHLNFNLLFYDPRGTGSSTVSSNYQDLSSQTYSTEANVEDVKALLDHFGVKNPVIPFAHSAGGAIALRLAQKYPERVQGLILYSAVPDLRVTGELIKSYEGSRFQLWQGAAWAKQLPEGERQHLQAVYDSVEGEIINEKLLFIQGLVPEMKLTRKSVFTFRHLAMLAALQGPEAFQDFLRTHMETIASHPQAPQAQPITTDVLFTQITSESSYLRSVLFCAEALSREDLNLPFYYPGVDLAYLCQGQDSPTRDQTEPLVLPAIKVPSLILTGDRDTHVPAFLQEKMKKSLPNSRQILFEQAGHVFHNSQPMPFFKALQSFLQDFDSSPEPGGTEFLVADQP